MENTDKKLEIIQKAIENKIGYDTEVIDIRGKASFADYFVITSATSSNQMFAIADNVEYEMEKEGFEKLNNSTGKSNEWLLLDYDEVIVHIIWNQLTQKKLRLLSAHMYRGWYMTV